MRIYNGPVIETIESLGGSASVTGPWIKDVYKREQLLCPDSSQRSVRESGTDTIKVDGRAINCRRFDYHGGEYQAGTLFWLDDNAVMLRYCWQQDAKTRWEVSLRDYDAD